MSDVERDRVLLIRIQIGLVSLRIEETLLAELLFGTCVSNCPSTRKVEELTHIVSCRKFNHQESQKIRITGIVAVNQISIFDSLNFLRF